MVGLQGIDSCLQLVHSLHGFFDIGGAGCSSLVVIDIPCLGGKGGHCGIYLGEHNCILAGIFAVGLCFLYTVKFLFGYSEVAGCDTVAVGCDCCGTLCGIVICKVECYEQVIAFLGSGVGGSRCGIIGCEFVVGGFKGLVRVGGDEFFPCVGIAFEAFELVLICVYLVDFSFEGFVEITYLFNNVGQFGRALFQKVDGCLYVGSVDNGGVAGFGLVELALEGCDTIVDCIYVLFEFAFYEFVFGYGFVQVLFKLVDACLCGDNRGAVVDILLQIFDSGLDVGIGFGICFVGEVGCLVMVVDILTHCRDCIGNGFHLAVVFSLE